MKCKWILNESGNGYLTECFSIYFHRIKDMKPYINFIYCPYCGKEIEEIEGD